ncbi:MAG: hypothetical protein COA84_12295 [Robiginitomaculum sp.]|nr:MAG: hypothetical protein COA84_12295 [Robiginitomaculum sp.]
MGYSDWKELASDALNLFDGVKNPELREKVNQMREIMLVLKEENISLKEENSELQRQLNDKDEMIPEGKYYVKKDDHGEIIGRFCSGCHDDKKKKIRLHAGGVTGWWDCPICKTSVTDSTYVEPNYDGNIGNGWMAS